MIALGIDTCERACSAAVVADGQVLASSQEDIGRGHAERLLPMLDELYSKSDTAADKIERIGITVGPGTFTGLRIGLSVARGLAFALKVPCIGISALETLAHQVGETSTVHTVIAGRGEHCFYQLYSWSADKQEPVAVAAAANLDLAEVRTFIEDKPGLVIGSGIVQLGLSEETMTRHTFCDPAMVAVLSTKKDIDSYPPDPLYLRAPDAAKAKPVFASKITANS